jgi:hypothetical protein
MLLTSMADRSQANSSGCRGSWSKVGQVQVEDRLASGASNLLSHAMKPPRAATNCDLTPANLRPRANRIGFRTGGQRVTIGAWLAVPRSPTPI